VIPVLVGATAAGKSSFAHQYAYENGLQIINADSLSFYQGMDIGTAKPSLAERKEVVYHLIDCARADQPMSAGSFVKEVNRILKEQKRVLIVGGSHFYIQALTYGMWDAPEVSLDVKNQVRSLPFSEVKEKVLFLDPQIDISVTDEYRFRRALEMMLSTSLSLTQIKNAHPYCFDERFCLIGIFRDEADLHVRIQKRTRQMLEQGLILEVQMLLGQYPEDLRSFQSIGYKQVMAYLKQQHPKGRKPVLTLEDLEQEISLATRQLVKSQQDWLKKWQRQGVLQSFFFDQDQSCLKTYLDHLFG
jgi:tRNA dimethylallyltransferase